MEFNKENMPRHIGIIMDGNRRWAKEQNKPVSFGHKEGAKTLERIVRFRIHNSLCIFNRKLEKSRRRSKNTNDVIAKLFRRLF